jgi:hypothetical protein
MSIANYSAGRCERLYPHGGAGCEVGSKEFCHVRPDGASHDGVIAGVYPNEIVAVRTVSGPSVATAEARSIAFR